jgi:hypothetical protein
MDNELIQMSGLGGENEAAGAAVATVVADE